MGNETSLFSSSSWQLGEDDHEDGDGDEDEDEATATEKSGMEVKVSI